MLFNSDRLPCPDLGLNPYRREGRRVVLRKERKCHYPQSPGRVPMERAQKMSPNPTPPEGQNQARSTLPRGGAGENSAPPRAGPGPLRSS